MSTEDTIAAIATPPGRGGVGIVRVSGPGVPDIARGLCGGLPPARRAVLRRFVDARGQPLDTGLVLFFPGPRSYTGEDVLELHGHGGPVVMDMLLERVLELGARLARPGEFSERAFLHGRLDLAQAEAVADLIESGSRAAARAALRSLEGEFSRAVHALGEALIELRMYVEAAIDFPEEEIDLLAEPELNGRLDALGEAFDRLMEQTRQGSLLQEGLHLVIVGAPNAGKSSLLNRLAGREAAIVTDIPGTTRDLVREAIQLDGVPIQLVDTAGLRESEDPVEREGVRRARAELARADLALLVIDDDRRDAAAERALQASLPPALEVLRCYNKIDLSGRPPGTVPGEPEAVALSARTGAGLQALRDRIRRRIGFSGAAEDTFIARRRHLDALRRAHAHFLAGTEVLRRERAGELLAEELRLAHRALGEITGEFTSEDLLERIFSRFCIGK
ncbi:MAG: tRNA uridine-5-carboxymethylaminomethyl(34) synthesis GTPase MnmE [Gammaproteobacteria bacterium]|nr:MAG: tRNA uridine-5-carboxymethylaminomethyl(34) synthesis GTPase MnmE [Gammaproteobacteria bacterium]